MQILIIIFDFFVIIKLLLAKNIHDLFEKFEKKASPLLVSFSSKDQVEISTLWICSRYYS